MTGEIFAVLKDHSILGRMIPAAIEAHSAAAFSRGARDALAAGNAPGALLHQLFGARTLALFDEIGPNEVADYLSGLLIGSEIGAGREWAARNGVAPDAVTLVGAPALCDRYATALRDAGIGATMGPRDAAARGLWRIAQRAGFLR
jgi:2-dehydro-3-deoxygalactonokinase